MAFSKTFPKTIDNSPYPRWEEVYLDEEEELREEQKARNDNIKLMNQCIEDAKEIMKKNNLKPFQTDLINISVALFEKRASHVIYFKESKAKEKFDSVNKKILKK
jgi:hypothetical protein